MADQTEVMARDYAPFGGGRPHGSRGGHHFHAHRARGGHPPVTMARELCREAKARRGDAERAARKPLARAATPPVEVLQAASKARGAASPTARAVVIFTAFFEGQEKRRRESRYSRSNNSEKGILRTRRYRGSTGGLEVHADQNRRARARKKEFLDGLLEKRPPHDPRTSVRRVRSNTSLGILSRE